MNNRKTVVQQLLSFKEPASANTRYGWIDYAKGIAIILVVYRHAAFGLRNTTGTDLPQQVIDINNMFFSFRMPLFFFLSGLFFKKSVDRRGEKGFLTGKINTLLYPYLLWAFIQISGQIVFSGMANAQRGPEDYLKILTQPRALDQLWYLFALFNVSWVYLLFYKLLRHNTYLLLALSLVFLGVAQYVVQVSAVYDIMLHFVFFCIGQLTASYFFSENTGKRLSSLWLLLVLTPVFAAVQFYFLYHQDMNLYLYAVIALVGSLYTIMLSFQLQHLGVLRFLKVVGHYSLYIYLLHVPIISVIRYVLLAKLHLQPYIVGVLVLLIVVSIPLSIIVYRILKMLKLGFLFKGPFKEDAGPQTVRVPAANT